MLPVPALEVSRVLYREVRQEEMRDIGVVRRGLQGGDLKKEIADGWYVTEEPPEWADWVAHHHGNMVYAIETPIDWMYKDGTDGTVVRPCPRCGHLPTAEGYDHCLGHIEGATSACCGHGVEEPYIIMGKRTEVQ